MKRILFSTLVIFFGLQSFAQNMKDLGKLTFKENAQQFLSDVPGANGRTMYNLSTMLSYGINNNGSFVFNQYKPPHIELLSLNSIVTCYAFRIMDYKNPGRNKQGTSHHLSKIATDRFFQVGKTV